VALAIRPVLNRFDINVKNGVPVGDHWRHGLERGLDRIESGREKAIQVNRGLVLCRRGIPDQCEVVGVSGPRAPHSIMLVPVFSMVPLQNLEIALLLPMGVFLTK
jgi:hypothetical protein